MSIARRLVAASMAGWASIVLAVAIQIGLVPLFLQHWSVQEFGVWITLQAMFGFCTALSTGFKTYVEYEFLKLGSNRNDAIGILLWSTLPAVFLVALLELLLTWAFTQTTHWPRLLDLPLHDEFNLAHRAALVLLIQLFTWTFFSTSIGLFQRAIVPFGYFARNSWWYLYGTLASTAATVAAVLLNMDIVGTSVAILAANLLFFVAQYAQLFGILKTYGVRAVRPQLRTGLFYGWMSLGTGLRNLLELVQTQGIRVLLTSSVGLKAMTSFSTTRTINNVGLQAIGTISNPILPELMTILNLRDNERLNHILWLFWLFTVGALGIGLNVLQIIAPTIFNLWTLGKINFDPVILALLSSALILYGMTQPLAAIVKGNNLQKVQMIASLGGATLIVALITLLPGRDALRGASLAILLSELLNHVIYRSAAKSWLQDRTLMWSGSSYADWLTMAALCMAGVALTSLFGQSPLIGVIVVLAQMLFLARLIARLPVQLRHEVIEKLKRKWT